MKNLFISIVLSALIFCAPVFVFAQMPGEDVFADSPMMTGIVEGAGTHFEIKDSDYLNIVLDSSEPIKARIESVPQMVVLSIDPVSDAASTHIILSGFLPSTTYYKYEDNYHNPVVFTTDLKGSYIYDQDISVSHLVFIQPRKSTKFISDNGSGGDCLSIGAWDAATKTCTLTTNVNETISIDSDYITLDGNGHAITGAGTGYGVYLFCRKGVTIRNLSISGFSYGISASYISSSFLSDNTLTDNTIYNNSVDGIYLRGVNNIVSRNRAYGNGRFGISLFQKSGNNLISDNTVYGNGLHGIYLFSTLLGRPW